MDEAGCPSLFREGASTVIEEFYGAPTRRKLEPTGAVSLGCGNPVAAAGLSVGEVVLDLGCGLGLDCLLAADAVGDSGRVMGIDLVGSMVKRAAVTAMRARLDNVGFAQSAMEMLPVPSGSVDVVISNCALNLSADKRAVLSEVARVLRPGGRLAVYDIFGDDVVPAELQADVRRWAGCVSGVLTAGEYVELLERVGLIETKVCEVSSAEGIVESVPGAPRLYVGEVTGRRSTLSAAMGEITRSAKRRF